MIGWTVVRALPDLEGKKWGPVTQAHLRALRPSEVRVVEADGCVKTDACTWRVTVHLDNSRRISRIEQEVEVDLPDGVDNGYALSVRLEADS